MGGRPLLIFRRPWPRAFCASLAAPTLIAPLLLCLSVAGCAVIERGASDVLNPVLRGGQRDAGPVGGFFDTLFIVDLHADTLLYERGLEGARWFHRSAGHVDAGRLATGNVAVQVLSTVSQYSFSRKIRRGDDVLRCHHENDPNLVDLLTFLQRPFSGSGETLLERIEAQGRRFRMGYEALGTVKLIETADDFRALGANWRARRAPRVGAILAIEGLHFYPDQEDALQRLWDRGFRMASLTHHFNNGLAGSSTGCTEEGLREPGKAALRKMRRMGWVLDLAHASASTIKDSLAWWDPRGTSLRQAPPVVSHTGLVGACAELEGRALMKCADADRRNISRENACSVARAGGVIGVIYWTRQHGLDRWASAAAALAAIVRTVGRLDDALSSPDENGVPCTAQDPAGGYRPAAHHIALGSDWDGAADAPFDATGLELLVTALRNDRCTTDACRARGNLDGRRFSEADIRAIVGWNACRVLLQSLPGAETERSADQFCTTLSRDASSQ